MTTTNALLASAIDQGFDQSRPIGRDDSGRFTRGIRVRCSQCEALVISGTPTHERTCPNTPEPDSDDDWTDDDN